MSEQNKVNILGIDVIRPDVEEAVENSLSYVREPGHAMFYFLTAESSLLCENDEAAADFVRGCDMVFPGDSHTERAFNRLNEESETAESAGHYAGDYMNRLFAVMNDRDLSIYTVMDSEETLTRLQEYILTEYPGINLDGILVEKESEGEFSRVVNDINACLPDIVFICLPPDLQIRFAGRYYGMMNTGLCVCIESMQPWIHKETVEIPGFFRAIGASGFYLWLKKKGKFQQLITGSIFRKRVLTEAGENGQTEEISENGQTEEIRKDGQAEEISEGSETEEIIEDSHADSETGEGSRDETANKPDPEQNLDPEKQNPAAQDSPDYGK